MSFWRSIFSGCLLFLLLPTYVHAASVSGDVKDSTGAVIVGAKVEVRGGDLSQPLTLTSDQTGHFVTPDLRPGSYALRVTAEGFEAREQVVDVKEVNLNLELELSLPVAKEQITVPGLNSQYANSDPLYRKLRNVGMDAAFRVEGFTFKCDTATFELKQGTLT